MGTGSGFGGKIEVTPSRDTWEFPKIGGTTLVVVIIRILVFFVSKYWGSRYFGKLPQQLVLSVCCIFKNCSTAASGLVNVKHIKRSARLRALGLAKKHMSSQEHALDIDT